MRSKTDMQNPAPKQAFGLGAFTVLVQNFVFCTVIALILWQVVPSIGKHGFFNAFVHAQAIGQSIYLISRLIVRIGRWMKFEERLLVLPSMMLATPLGIYTGLVLAAGLLGLPNATPVVDEQLITSIIIGFTASFAFSWYLNSKQKLLRLELLASEERRRAEQARHTMLRAQLEPHMLFNTLANLRALIESDPVQATEMLDRLDNFLRETLSSSEAVTMPLTHEFKVLDDYLALMGVRLGDRLSYQLHPPDNCKEVSVPSLILQPLVENAIRHGIEPQLEGGTINVYASRLANTLSLTVCDTGAGFSTSSADVSGRAQNGRAHDSNTQKGGFGLKNLRDRLQTIYGDAASVEFESMTLKADSTGTKVTVQLPLITETK